MARSAPDPDTYTLRRPHWHAGTEHPAGTTLTGLRPDQIERIRAAEDAALAAASAPANPIEDVTHG